MTFDYTYFAYGVGFVMLGWAVGMVISAIFSVLSKVDRVGSVSYKILFLLVFSFLVLYAVYASSVSAVPPVDPGGNPDTALLTQIQADVAVIKAQLTASGSMDWNKSMSFLAGLLTSISVVVAARMRL